MNRIQKIFSEVPNTYETINHILTMGLDILWRKKAARHAKQVGGTHLLDVCSGTGDMALLLRRFFKNKATIIASDFCFPMIQKGANKPDADTIHFVASDSLRLPFRDNSFDIVTISFATRNINVTPDILSQYFCEFYRILKPGGRFINLETSQPRLKIIRGLFHLYVRLFVAPVGYLISGSKTAYRYLSYTIPRFFDAEELLDILYKAGYNKVNFSYMTLGTCAIHTAIK